MQDQNLKNRNEEMVSTYWISHTDFKTTENDIVIFTGFKCFAHLKKPIWCQEWFLAKGKTYFKQTAILFLFIHEINKAF